VVPFNLSAGKLSGVQLNVLNRHAATLKILSLKAAILKILQFAGYNY